MKGGMGRDGAGGEKRGRGGVRCGEEVSLTGLASMLGKVWAGLP